MHWKVRERKKHRHWKKYHQEPEKEMQETKERYRDPGPGDEMWIKCGFNPGYV